MSVRITAMSAAAVALAASTALVLPGQAGAVSGEAAQQRQNLDCGFTRAMVAKDRGWPNAAHYKHCGPKPVLLLLHNALKKGNFCSPPHQAHEASQLPLIDNFYEPMSAEVVGDCGGVG